VTEIDVDFTNIPDGYSTAFGDEEIFVNETAQPQTKIVDELVPQQPRYGYSSDQPERIGIVYVNRE
jgi:hypothetical protein